MIKGNKFSYSKGENDVIKNHDMMKIDRLSNWNSTCKNFYLRACKKYHTQRKNTNSIHVCDAHELNNTSSLKNRSITEVVWAS